MKKAFEQFEEEILSLPNISLITDADKHLFTEFFSKNKDSLSYGNAWPFIIQSTFFRGYKFFDGDSLIAFTIKEPKKSLFVISKVLGKDALEKAVELADSLQKFSQEKVIVKNLSASEFHFLESKGFSDYAVGDYWSKFYNYDDDTFPETVIQLRPLIAKSGSDYKSLRYHLNNFSKKNAFEILEYDNKKHFLPAKSVLNKWVSFVRKRYPSYLQKDPIYLHSIDLHEEYLKQEPVGVNGKDFFSNILFVKPSRPAGTEPIASNRLCISSRKCVDSAPAGFALLSRISEKCVGVYSNFCDNSFQGLSETILFHSLKKAFEAGYEFANLGGAEFENLMQFRWKFNPMAYLQRYHAVLYEGTK